MLKDLRNYIMENDFMVNYLKNKINIVNYESIDHFDDNKIMIRYDDGLLIIKGEDLTISKLLKDELLISGKVIEIKFKWKVNYH